MALEQEIKAAKERLGLPPETPVVSCYEAGRDGGPSSWAIGLASAATPTGFTAGRSTANPVMTAPGAGCGNPELARVGSRVLRHRGRYWMLYHRGENWRAWSTDLRTWTQEGVVWGYDRADPEGYSCGDGALGEFGAVLVVSGGITGAATAGNSTLTLGGTTVSSTGERRTLLPDSVLLAGPITSFSAAPSASHQLFD